MRRGDSARHCKHTKEMAKGQAIVVRGEFVFLVDVVDGDSTVVCELDRPVPMCPAPMLASAMTEPVSGAAFDRRFAGGAWVMEEKLDGHRLIAVVTDGQVAAFARPGRDGVAKSRDLPAHIVTELQRFPDGVYDGELLAPSGKSWDVTTVGAQLVFVVFDVLHVEGSYDRRRTALLDALRVLPLGQTAVSTVESVAPSWSAVEAIWKRGGEGVIVKRRASYYRPGYRSPDWVKVKQSHAATLTITGFDAGKSGPYSALKLRDVDGHDTTVKTLDNELLRAIAAAPTSYLGRRVVISFQEKTPSGSYRHGMFDHFAGKGE